MSLLPPTILEFVRLVGYGKAMALVHEFGGQDFRVPKTEAGDNWAALVEVIGEPATRTLTASFGGSESVYIARCHAALKAERNRRIVARYDVLLAEGHSGRGAVSVLVREFGLCYRQIEKIVNAPQPEAPTTAAQGNLF